MDIKTHQAIDRVINIEGLIVVRLAHLINGDEISQLGANASAPARRDLS